MSFDYIIGQYDEISHLIYYDDSSNISTYERTRYALINMNTSKLAK